MKTFRRADIHAHLNFAAFEADRDEVVLRTLESGTAVINVGTQLDTSRKAVELADKYPEGVYAIVGLHPIHTVVSFHDEKELGFGGSPAANGGRSGFTSRGEAFNASEYRKLLANPKTVGIGECGLDYYRLDADSKSKQREAFLAQIALANECRKPLMLHVREAYGDALDILKANAKVGGNAHFFAGTVEEAGRFLDLGFTLSFTGVITFAKEYGKLVEFTPLDMIQAETDCPFVAPVPHRGKRNEPAYVSEVIEKIARIKKLQVEQVEQTLLDNARRIFGLRL